MENVMKELDKALNISKSKESQSVIVIGPSGIGKTRMVKNWIEDNGLKFRQIACNTLLYNRKNIFGYTLEDSFNFESKDYEVIFFDMIDCCKNQVREILKQKVLEYKRQPGKLIVATGWNEAGHFGYEKLTEDFLNVFDVVISMNY